ncbi:MAG: phosphatase PAP2 family protein [Lachnospiraceae bacterium]|nr:phosphatase PAP2 family protein [Lachnospiraceae bacterium]
MTEIRKERLGAKVRAFVKEQNVPHIFPFILYLIGYMFVFRYLETVHRTGYVDVSSELDKMIPFCEAFIVPYLSWFFFQAVWVVLVFVIDRKTYDQLTTMLMIGMTVFLVVSFLVPTRLSLRPYSIPRNNVFVKWCLALWKLDTPTNVWPSIHVFNTTALMMTLFTSANRFLKKKIVQISVVFWCVMIILSTMFLKQHSIGDVISALVLNGISYVMVYQAGWSLRFREWDRRWAESLGKYWYD